MACKCSCWRNSTRLIRDKYRLPIISKMCMAGRRSPGPLHFWTIGLQISSMTRLVQFDALDDVWCFDFMSSVIIQTGDKDFNLTPDAKDLLRDRGVRNICVRYTPGHVSKLPQGPYFLHHGEIYEAYRLYPDHAGAFVVATVPADNGGAQVYSYRIAMNTTYKNTKVPSF